MMEVSNQKIEATHQVRELRNKLIDLPELDIDFLIKEGFHKAMLPKEMGGLNLNIIDMSELLVDISSICHYSGLILSMHYYTVGGLKSSSINSLERYLNDVNREGALFGSISNPKVQPFFTREQTKEAIGITYTNINGEITINGTKKYVSGAKLIRYLPVYAYNEELDNRFPVSVFIVDMQKQGVHIIEDNWISNSMTPTDTFDIFFENVEVNNSLFKEGEGIESTNNLVYWFRIAISSVYLGVCEAAYKHVIQMVKSNKKLLTDISVQNKIADIKIKLELARSQLIRTSQIVHEDLQTNSNSIDVKNATLITKHIISNNVNEILNESLKIKGISSLNKGDFLERLSRDARAAYFHPPQEYKIIEELAINELGIIKLTRN